jgi:hypothetical protein
MSESQDADVIVTLLAEYSQKLRLSYEELYRIRQSRFVFASAFSILVIIGSMAIGISIKFEILKSNFDMIIVIGVSALTFVLLFYMAFVVQLNKMGFMKREISVLASQLERLIRSASQFQEHGERNFGKRIELDLRLADAEGTLSLVSRVLRDREVHNS